MYRKDYSLTVFSGLQNTSLGLISVHIDFRLSVNKTILADAGFVRSWKLNLRLTTRAEDSHAAPDSYVIHFCALLYAGRAYSVVTKIAIRIPNVIRRLGYFSSSFKVGKVYRGSSVYTACSTACKKSRQFL